MKIRIIGWLLKCYPAAWQSEYGGELEDLLNRRPLIASTILNVLWSAVREQARRPLTRSLLGALLASACIFATAVLFSKPLWHLLSWSAIQSLRNHGIVPPNLVAERPWEQLEVIYLEIPLLATAAVAYPLALLMAGRSLRLSWRAAACWSAGLYVCGFLIGLAAWLNGFLGVLLNTLPHAPMISISYFFELLAATTLGLTLIFQVPVLLVCASVRLKEHHNPSAH